MKILFSITYYRPYVSGLTLAASRWAEGLTQRGEHVTVLTMRHDAALPESQVYRRTKIVRASWLARISKGFISWDWIVKSIRIVREHDVVVCHLPQFEGLVPALVAKLYAKPVVSVYHCEVALPAGFMNGLIQSLLEVSHFLVLLVSDAVVTYTADYARASRLLRLLRQYRPGARVTTITPSIVMPREQKRLTNMLARKAGRADVIIGIAARLAQEKGIEYVLEALPHIREHSAPAKVKVVVAGPMEPVGEAAYKTKITRLVRAYKQQVVFLGEIPPEYMGSFYRMIDLLVLPSINSTEAFGMVQVEAMLMGKPVVATDLPGVRVPVRKTGMGVVVPPRNPQALSDAIIDVIRHPSTYTKPVSVVTKLFSSTATIGKFRAILVSLAG